MVLLAGVAPAQGPAWCPPRAPAWYPPSGAEIAHLLLHYDGALAEALAPVWADLLPALGSAVRITIAVGRSDHAEPARALARACRTPADQVDVVCVGRELSIWPRDAGFVLAEPAATVIGLPGRGARPRLGDLCAVRLSAARLPAAGSITAPLDLDGGQVVFGRQRVFVGGRGIESAALRDRALAWLPGAVMFVEAPLGAPHPHLDMFFAAVDDDVVLLGEVGCPGTLAAGYRAIADRLGAQGVRVLRLPIVHLGAGRVLTWTNALTETRGEPVAYVPSYGTALDRVAFAVWRRCGFRVQPIDCARLAPWGGAVRCLTNVLAWREVGAGAPPSEPQRAGGADHMLHCDPHPVADAQ